MYVCRCTVLILIFQFTIRQTISIAIDQARQTRASHHLWHRIASQSMLSSYLIQSETVRLSGHNCLRFEWLKYGVHNSHK